jgi:hypothetical protein
MASFKSILSDIGHGLKVFFEKVIPGAVAAEPLVDAIFPGIGMLFNTVVNEVASVEGISVAAGAQSGTGTQKLALVLGNPNVQSAITAIETNLGVSINQTQQTSIINAIVALLNSIPAPASSTSTPVTQAVPTVSAAI